MKKSPIFNAVLITSIILIQNLAGQEISLAEAFDTSGINWSVTAGPFPGADPFEVASENYWHPVSDESYDGVDSLHVRMPDGQDAVSSIAALIQAPVQFSFWYKTDPEESSNLHTYWVKEGTTQGNVAEYLSSEEWAQYTVTIREQMNIFLRISVNNHSTANDWDAWIDQFEVNTSFPPEIVEFPELVGALLGKQTTIHVEAEGVGTVTYKWFRNDIEVPGATEASIVVPAANEVGEATYKVEVTDSLGSVLSPPATVRFFDINEALDNQDLVFDVEDSLSGSYSEMAVIGTDAYDGEDAIYLEFFDALRDHQYHQTSRSISTHIEGPTTLKFRYRDLIAVRINGENPNVSLYAYNYNEEDGDWTIAYVPIPGGNNEVEFSATPYFFSKSGSGVLDQVELVTQPKVFFNATAYSRLEGTDIPILYTFINGGSTTHQLIKGEEVIATSENERVTLPSAQTSDSGTYRIRLVNEYEEEAFSDEFEIQVFNEQLGNALEQPDLSWTTEGQDPWVSQFHQTYDGEDAVQRVPWITPSVSIFPSQLQVEYDDRPNRLTTTIAGPAYISFWWRGGFFEANNREVWLNESDHSQWEKANILLTSETNALSWDSSYLDRIRIEYLDEDPFRFWAFNHYDSETVLNNYSIILEGDDDFDGWSNFLEWALNKNLDFPNGAQAYEFIEDNGQLYLGITFSRQGNLGSYMVCLEASDDMQSWEKIESIVSETYHESNDTYTVTIRDTQPIDEGSRFIRLVVTDEL